MNNAYQHPVCTLLVVFASGATGCNALLSPNPGENFENSENAVARQGSDRPLGSGPIGEPQKDLCGFSPTQVRKLTNEQYDNSVRDLLGSSSSFASSFPGEQVVAGFTNNAAAAIVNEQLVGGYATAAEQLSADAVEDLGNLMPCDSERPRCVRRFIREFGRRAFRRPLTSDEIDNLFQVYEVGAEFTFKDGVEFVVNAILQSPDFLYSAQTVNSDGRLDAFALASKLSYFLWNTTPDDQLLDAAEAGELDDPAGFASQAERMIDDPRSRDSIRSFIRQWLGFSDFDTVSISTDDYPDFYPELVDLWQQQLVLFAEEAIFSGKGFEDLMTGNYTFVNDDMAAIYGIDAPGSDELTRAELPPGHPGGLLGQPGLLAAHSKGLSSIHRGQFVLSRFLCGGLPPPPDELEVPDVDPEGLSLREYIDSLTTQGSCGTCHTVMNPVGHVFGEFDELGRFGTMDSYGFEVDAAADVPIGSEQVRVDGAMEMSEVMLESVDVRQCFVRNMYRYAVSRVETEADSCSIHDLTAGFDDVGDVRSLLMSIVTDDTFTHGVPL